MKSQNIGLLSKENTIKIFDFSVSLSNQDKVFAGVTGLQGTTLFLCPEAFGEKFGYDGYKADIWAAGIILY